MTTWPLTGLQDIYHERKYFKLQNIYYAFFESIFQTPKKGYIYIYIYISTNFNETWTIITIYMTNIRAKKEKNSSQKSLLAKQRRMIIDSLIALIVIQRFYIQHTKKKCVGKTLYLATTMNQYELKLHNWPLFTQHMYKLLLIHHVTHMTHILFILPTSKMTSLYIINICMLEYWLSLNKYHSYITQLHSIT